MSDFPKVYVAREPMQPHLPGKHHFIIRATSHDPGVRSLRGYPSERAARVAGHRYADHFKKET